MRSTVWPPGPLYQRLAQVDGGLQDFILGLDGLRVGLVGALRNDHIDQLTRHIDVGGFHRTRHDGTQHAGTRRTDQLLARLSGGVPDVVTSWRQTLGVTEVSQGDLSGGTRLLVGVVAHDNAVLVDGNAYQRTGGIAVLGQGADGGVIAKLGRTRKVEIEADIIGAAGGGKGKSYLRACQAINGC